MGGFLPPFRFSHGKGLEGDASTTEMCFPGVQQGDTDGCELCPYTGGEQGQDFSVR